MPSDATNSDSKRNFFKKPAWVIERQLQSAKEASRLFERADDCHAGIVAEQERRKKAKEEKSERARQAEREKKEKEEERKKRKAKDLMARTLSEAFPDADSPSEALHSPKRKATVIELDDSDDESVQPNEHDAKYTDSNNYKVPANRALLDSSTNCEAADSSGDVDGADLQTSENSLRNTSIIPDAQNDRTPADPTSAGAANDANPPLDILIDTKIPGTRPLVVKRYYKDNLRPVRKTWCEKQGFSSEQARNVILTWRGKKLFDVANCKSLGIELDSCGDPVIKTGTDGYDGGGDKIVFVATTYELYAQEQKAAEEATKRKVEPGSDEDDSSPKEEQIRIVLRTKGRKESRLAVRPVRTIVLKSKVPY